MYKANRHSSYIIEYISTQPQPFSLPVLHSASHSARISHTHTLFPGQSSHIIHFWPLHLPNRTQVYVPNIKQQWYQAHLHYVKFLTNKITNHSNHWCQVKLKAWCPCTCNRTDKAPPFLKHSLLFLHFNSETEIYITQTCVRFCVWNCSPTPTYMAMSALRHPWAKLRHPCHLCVPVSYTHLTLPTSGRV